MCVLTTPGTEYKIHVVKSRVSICTGPSDVSNDILSSAEYYIIKVFIPEVQCDYIQPHTHLYSLGKIVGSGKDRSVMCILILYILL